MLIKQRLDALTSLRFIAAAMIVVLHSHGLFGTKEDVSSSFAWTQGVSFFFVLSGFILAFVYPKLDNWNAIRNFLHARVARVWPALFMSFFFAFWLLSLSWDDKTGFANLLMVNAWIPYQSYYFSYNAPSWSISTEFFFYLAFPLLIYQWESTWQVKLILAMGGVLLTVLLSKQLNLPFSSSNNEVLTSNSLIYIHPISRLFEFVFGILLVSSWRKKVSHIQWTRSHATWIEVSAVLFACASMYFTAPLVKALQNTGEDTIAVWFAGSGSMFAFGVLIYIMALGRGRISEWLSHPILVMLGEISFSLYLLHYTLLSYYRNNITFFPHLPNLLSWAIFWTIALLASYLMWALIEMPGRRLMLGNLAHKTHGTKAMKASWHQHLNWNRNTFSAAIVLAALIATIYFSMSNIRFITDSEADAMTPKALRPVVGTQFGNLFILRGLKILHQEDGLHIDIAWEALVDKKLTFTNVIHLTNAKGEVLLQADYKQPLYRAATKRGEIWQDSIFIEAKKLNGQESQLALALYQTYRSPSDLLFVDRGQRDWGNKRLLVPLTY